VTINSKAAVNIFEVRPAVGNSTVCALFDGSGQWRAYAM